MLALFALIPGKDWLYSGIIALLIAGGLYERHHLISEGQAHEIAVLKDSSDKLVAAANAKIVNLNMAHLAQVKSIVGVLNEQQRTNSLQSASDAQRLREYDAYRSAHPAMGSPALKPKDSGSGVSSAPGSSDIVSRLGSVGLELAGAVRDGQNALKSCIAERNDLTGK